METRDLFLTSEERYEVYCVKSSERPHLLETYQGSCNNDEQHPEEVEPPPLTDGCDIAGWRCQHLVPTSPSWEAALNVGLGCPLLRRESQLPMVSACAMNESQWESLKNLLMNQPTTKVDRIPCSIASQTIEDTTTNSLEEEEVVVYLKGQKRTFVRPKRNRFSKWEAANYPVIITDATTDWNLEAWTYDKLRQQFGCVPWRFSDTHGAMMTLDIYHKYSTTEGRAEDSPLAVYDSEFGDDTSPMQGLLQDYTVPPCFSQDLFALVVDVDDESADENDNANTCNNQEDEIPGLAEATQDEASSQESQNDEEASRNNYTRPPWRWILMGPPRSGTGLHIDPLWTNAWVTLFEGVKRWILIPPHVTLPPGAGLREPQVPSVLWFRDYYHDVIKLEGVVEILQQPGETVFVPNGWPHLVLNLERTVAVTHNYASEFGPFERMWQQVAKDEPEFAQQWLAGLVQHRPDLAARIVEASSDQEGGKGQQ